MAIFPVTGRKIKSVVASDQALMPLANEIRLLAQSRRQDKAVSETLSAADLTEAGLESAVLLENTGHAALHLSLPPNGEQGFGALVLDPSRS